MTLSPYAIWAPLDGPIANLPLTDPTAPASAADAARFAARVEALGYSALWIPEGFGRNPLVFAAWLLANTTSLTLATGIASIYARDAMATAAARRGLNEQSDGRFLLGLGVSHAKIVTPVRGHGYGKPLAAMRAYLEAMTQAPYLARAPQAQGPLVLAALRDGMLELAAECADGAHPYCVTPDHTARARRILGPGKLLCVEQKLLLEADPARARAIGRKALDIYLGFENYRNAWKTMGFTDDDMDGGGSDRLIDAMIGWGDEQALRRRVQDHLDAGATQVCIQPLSDAGGIDMNVVELLAPSPVR